MKKCDLYYGSTLYHHGIKGMRWGFRRYQNPDGTLTEAGRRRRYRTDDVKERVADDRLLSGGIRVASQATGSLSSVYSKYKGNKRAMKVDVTKMTDDDLRREITRMQLEQNYKSLISSNVERGEYHVQNLINTGAATLAITSSAIGLASAIYKLRNESRGG